MGSSPSRLALSSLPNDNSTLYIALSPCKWLPRQESVVRAPETALNADIGAIRLRLRSLYACSRCVRCRGGWLIVSLMPSSPGVSSRVLEVDTEALTGLNAPHWSVPVTELDGASGGPRAVEVRPEGRGVGPRKYKSRKNRCTLITVLAKTLSNYPPFFQAMVCLEISLPSSLETQHICSDFCRIKRACCTIEVAAPCLLCKANSRGANRIRSAYPTTC
jgi:hypothetical protein